MPIVGTCLKLGLTVDNAELKVGESWAYRARQVDDAEVLKMGTQRPARVLVRFGDERFEGRQEWVPPARLKVRCAAVDTFRQSEARWDRMLDLGMESEDPADAAANQVFDTLIDRNIARMEYREGGACRITNSQSLAILTDLEAEAWEQCADAFRESEDLVVPWPITEKIAAATARRNPTPLLDAMAEEERHGRRLRDLWSGIPGTR